MRIHLFLPLPVLQAALQQTFDSPMAWMDPEEMDKSLAEVDVHPTGPLQLSSHEGSLESLLPLKAGIKLRRSGNSFLAGIPQVEKVDMDLLVIFTTQLSLEEDWKLKARSKAGYQWTRKPSWGGGFLKLPITSFVGPILKRELEKVAAKVDAFIMKEVQLKDILWETWTFLQAPIHIPTESQIDLYLDLNLPREEVIGSEIKVEKGEMSMVFDLDLPPMALEVRSKPSPQSPPKLLPAYRMQELKVEEEEVDLKAFITFEEIIRLLEEMSLRPDLHTPLHLRSPALRQEGEILDLGAMVEGKRRSIPIRGLLALRGKISWDQESSLFYLDNFSFRLPKANLPLKIAYSLNRKAFRREIKALVEKEMNQIKTKILSDILENIRRFEVNTQVRLRVLKPEVILRDVEVGKEELAFVLTLRGRPEVEIKELEF